MQSLPCWLSTLTRFDPSIVDSGHLRKPNRLRGMETDGDTPERPVRRLRRQRLKQLLKEFGGPTALGRHAEASATTLIAIEKGRRDLGDELASKLEEKCGKPFGWMDGVPSDEALEIALALDAIADPEHKRIAMALAYSYAHRPAAVQAGVSAELVPIGRQTADR